MFSALLSLAGFALACFLLAANPRKWSESQSIISGLAVVDAGYFGVLFASAAAYAGFGKRWIGFTHVVLMAGLSVCCIAQGLSTLNDKTIMGGQGPDANPAAGVGYVIAMGIVMLGVVCGIVAVVVCLKLVRSSAEERSKHVRS